MPYKTISVSELHVNPHNDRHGELPSEDAAIKWLLKSRANHMRNLTKDIVAEGRVYEPPLVFEDENGYVVLDGNRRVTCLKLLSNPSLSPDEDWRSFFVQQSLKLQSGTVPDTIECRIETDLDYIDEILYRRHTGSQNGIGQSQWNDVAKSNFVERSGKKTKVNLAEEVEALLRSSGLVSETFSLPRSNFNRLLSGQAQRNRVGISLQKNKLTFVHVPDKAMTALKRISEDLSLGNKTLKDIWDVEGKNKYLNKLDHEGVLPTVADALEYPVQFTYPYPDFSSNAPQSSSPSPETSTNSHKEQDEDSKVNDEQEAHQVPVHVKPSYDLATRSTLIPQGFEYNLHKSPELSRILAIWNELEWKLTFDAHTNAIAVLFRVLLELSVDYYIGLNELEIFPNEKLKNRFVKVVEDQEKKGKLAKKAVEVLKKFPQTEPILSAHSMNQYVHAGDFSPSPDHLRPMWDNLQKVILNCLSKN